MMTVIGDDCYWCQVSVPTGRKGLRAAVASLRRCGWRVNAIPMGPQVTDTGLWRLTLIDVRGVRVSIDVVRNILRRYGLAVQ